MSDRKRRILTGVVAVVVIGYGGWAWYTASPVRPLAKAIRYGDRDEKSTALHQLPQVVATPTDVDLAIEVLFEALRDPNLEVRAEATEAIRELYATRQRNLDGAETNKALDARVEVVRRALLETLRDPEAFVRRQAILAIEACGQADPDEPAPQVLLEMLEDPSESVRAAGMRVILAYQSAAGAVLKVGLERYPSEGQEGKVAIRGAIAAGRYGPEHLPELLETLTQTDINLQGSGLHAIHQMGPKARSAIPAVMEYIRRGVAAPRRPPGRDNTDPDVILNALGNLVALSPKETPSPEVVAFLREFLTMPKAAPWYYTACYQLACLGEEARPAIPDVLRVFESNPVGTEGRQLIARSLAHLAKGTDMEPKVLDVLVRAWKANPDEKVELGVHQALIELRPDSETLLPEARHFKDYEFWKLDFSRR